MAWYNAGTVTATNNSGTITGAGTAFISNIRVGDGITISGSTSLHEVTNIISETQLTVSPVYPGTTGSGKTYGVAPVQGYVQGLADQAKQLILSYSSILGSSGAYDTTPGRLLRVGDFGLGATDLSDFGGDLNTLNTTGFYLAGGATNMPAGHSAGFVTVKTNAQNNTIQTFESQGTTTCFERANGGGGWTPWRLRYNQSTILGTVSQSAGVPTGAVIERGANASGEWTRFADGTMICTRVGFVSPSVPANAIGSGIAIFMPAAFINTNFAVSCVGYPLGSWDYYGTQVVVPSSTTSATVFIRNGVTAQTFSLYFLAIGRWF